MIKILCGLKGTGKTTRLINIANESKETCKGDIVFIEASNKKIYDLKNNIRLINAMEFNIKNIESFYGFLCGIISENFDIKEIYINRLYKLFEFNVDELTYLIEKLEKLCPKFNIDFILSMKCNVEDLPQDYKKYAL